MDFSNHVFLKIETVFQLVISQKERITSDRRYLVYYSKLYATYPKKISFGGAFIRPEKLTMKFLNNKPVFHWLYCHVMILFTDTQYCFLT